MVASRAAASDMGYSLWCLALPLLTTVRAAVLELLVPVLAAGFAVGGCAAELRARSGTMRLPHADAGASTP